MRRGWLQRLPNKGYDPPLGRPAPTSEKTPSTRLGELPAIRLRRRKAALVRPGERPLLPEPALPPDSKSPGGCLEHPLACPFATRRPCCPPPTPQGRSPACPGHPPVCPSQPRPGHGLGS